MIKYIFSVNIAYNKTINKNDENFDNCITLHLKFIRYVIRSRTRCFVLIGLFLISFSN